MNLGLVFVQQGTATIHTLYRATLVTISGCIDCMPLPDTGKNPGFSGDLLISSFKGRRLAQPLMHLADTTDRVVGLRTTGLGQRLSLLVAVVVSLAADSIQNYRPL